MAIATGLMGIISNLAIAWTLALLRWFSMTMFNTALTTFIQLRWRSGVLPGVLSTGMVMGESGRLTGSFLVLPLALITVQGAFATAALIITAAALTLLPYRGVHEWLGLGKP